MFNSVRLTFRERLIRAVQFKDLDELPFNPSFGLMPGLLDEWRAQGLPEGINTDQDVYKSFGFPPQERSLPVNTVFIPPFERRVIEETDEFRIETDWLGRKTKLIKSSASIPLALEFPVKDAGSWADYKRRLAFSEDRIGAGLERTVKLNIEAGLPNKIWLWGFFWLPRDLMGEENLCVAYYETPELVHDILETWCSLLEKTLDRALDRAPVDMLLVGEDMAYKNACMIGKTIFDEFMRPYYLRIQKLVLKHSVPIFAVDSDGCLNELIHWLADCGVNYVGPNEVAAGNDITAYRKTFGRTMAYDGGLEKQTLRKGRAAIDAMLEKTIPFMKATGGGWSVGLDHRVLEGTPLADFKYYVDRVREMIKF
jgi:uroporphyrinogen decarboxylase